ncbi:hypothetical protein D3218_13610 [Aureimonas flava]|uniref:Uncharacterized protein n=1 Tax=Aureimonas flava TaxID=2320271 RepID=A0A3A1WHL4_9HYPH|nr:hypothetical protein [Aureimonas flava]RIX99509.1 hypothetical protein D3218_13610 [Aureimonas flava]
MRRPVRQAAILTTLMATTACLVAVDASAQTSRTSLADAISRSVNQAVATGNTPNNSVAVGVNRTQTNTGGSNTVVNDTPTTVVNGRSFSITGATRSGNASSTQSESRSLSTK